jgi:hypothetical protein
MPFSEYDAILANADAYLIYGDLDKPFHLCECECDECEGWREKKGRPRRKELRKLIKE